MGIKWGLNILEQQSLRSFVLFGVCEKFALLPTGSRQWRTHSLSVLVVLFTVLVFPIN